MTPEERKMIDELFERLAKLEDNPRDDDAVNAINEGLDRAPNALYPLVQSVLVQDEALKRADARIRELEAELGIDGDQPPQQQKSFLDGMRREQGSVPSVRPSEEPRRDPWAQARERLQPGQPSAGYQQQQGGGYQQQPGGYQQQPGGYPPQQEQGGGGGGSFLGTAAATAAGVVGGALLMNSMRGMFGGGQQGGGGNRAFDQGGGGAPWGGGGSGGSGDLGRQAGLEDIGRGGGGRTAAADDSGGSQQRQGAFDVAQNDASADDDGEYEDDDGDFDDDSGDDTQTA